MSVLAEKTEELARVREKAVQGGGAKRVEAQHAKDKLTARERIDILIDKGTFEEIDPFVTHRCTDFGIGEEHYLGDAVVTGYGKVDGRLTFVYAQDFTVFGGSLSIVVGEKIGKIMDLAARSGAPCIGLLDSGGARIQEGAVSLIGYDMLFVRNTLYSGVIPQLSVVMGPCAGGAVYSPAIADFIFMVKGAGQMYITGPVVVKAVTGEDISLDDLGGAMVNARKSGNCHFVANTDEESLQMVRRLLSFLPQNNREKTPKKDISDDPERRDEELLNIIPDRSNQVYDMRKIITRVVDNKDFMEVHRLFGQSSIVGFARLAGRSVGIVAQQPQYLAGSLDIDTSDKIARFVRFCDCFNVPIITFVDVPGYLPGTQQEYGGIIRHGAKILFAYSEATVPKVSVVTRKAYGGAYLAMSSKGLRGDINYAWPSAEIAVMGPDGAVDVIQRKEIKESANPAETRARLIAEYREKFANPYVSASYGYIDDVIDPRDTRPKLIHALEMLENKEDTLPYKKHSNIPL